MRIALGTVQFGLPYGIANKTGKVSQVEANAMLKLAAAHGIDTLDTAMAYGDSEACLGKMGINGFKVITKLPVLPEDCVDVSTWINEQLSSSLARLGLSSVYGLLLHRPAQLLESNGKKLFHALQEVKQAGLVKKVGISIYGSNELAQLTKSFHLDLVQAPFNLIDQGLITSGCLMRLKEEDIEIHTRSSFLQGLLLMSRETIPSKFLPWSESWEKWHKWLSKQNISALQTCLSFPLSFPEIDRVIVGADSVIQLQQIIEAASTPTPVIFPNISCDDENLINPSRWIKL